MFGGLRFSKSTSALFGAGADKSAESGSNVNGRSSSVNDSLFQKINEAENHAKLIIKDGQSRYVSGIKQNVLRLVHEWLEKENSNIFTLYGKMGCGKSFFAARLYQETATKDNLHTVAFSSQQIYRDTTSVRNMLLSIAHQLYTGVPACRKYLSEHPLDSESIAALTESVLIASFEESAPQKPVLIIIDGLDEYPAEDCESFLETLGRLRARIHPRVKIFFTSRPEAYIMSAIACESEDSSYHIEKNEGQSHADCARFVDVKCEKADVRIEEDLKRQLIEKSECSLKYLECFFNDIAFGAIQITPDFIENLPRGLSQYYRDQLVRYFGEEKLTFYQTKIVPLLELLCVVLRPITLSEASDILGCKESDINRIISKSGTLLWKNNQYVMLYQSESIREFLIDDRYCPEKYRIDRENGRARVLERLQTLMDEGEDIESNMYLFNCAVEHILEQASISRRDWMLLVRLVGCYSHKSDVMRKFAVQLLERSVREIQTFFQHLTAEGSPVNPLLQDACCVRVIGVAIDEMRTDKLLSVLDSITPEDTFEFFINYGRGRCLRTRRKDDEALALMEPYLDSDTSDDPRTMLRWSYYADEICRVYRRSNRITWEENTALHVKIITNTEGLCRLYQHKDSPLYLVTLRSLSVSYDQLARLSEYLEKITPPEKREACAKTLQSVLKLQETDPSKLGFFLWGAIACYKESLRLSKLCQQNDSFSDSRIYDLYYSFYALGRLYGEEDFPGYHPDKARAYFEDCLSSILDIAIRPESHERYIQVPIRVYEKLVELYIAARDFETARAYLEKDGQMRDLYALYHPGSDSEFKRCYGTELAADLIEAQHGLDEAVSTYVLAAEQYKACAKKYDDEFVQRAAGVVYARMADAYKQKGDAQKRAEFTRLQMAEYETSFRLFPTESWKWSYAIAKENLAVALRDAQPSDSLQERIALMESAIALYRELEAEHPQVDKYHDAYLYPLYFIFWEYCHNDQFDKAEEVMRENLVLLRRLIEMQASCYAFLEVPIHQFLYLRERVPELNEDEQLFADCKQYLEEVTPLTKEADFEEMKCRFLNYEGERTAKTEGIEAAEPLFLDAAKIAHAFAERQNSERTWRLVTDNYVDLYLHFDKSSRHREKALSYLQEALKVIDHALPHLTDAFDLRRLQGHLYGIMADKLKDSSEVENVAACAELYILQIRQYLFVHKHTGEQKLLERIQTTFAKVERFLVLQESFVKLSHKTKTASVDELRPYVDFILNLYNNLFSEEKAKEKTEYYQKLLEDLEGV